MSNGTPNRVRRLFRENAAGLVCRHRQIRIPGTLLRHAVLHPLVGQIKDGLQRLHFFLRVGAKVGKAVLEYHDEAKRGGDKERDPEDGANKVHVAAGVSSASPMLGQIVSPPASQPPRVVMLPRQGLAPGGRFEAGEARRRLPCPPQSRLPHPLQAGAFSAGRPFYPGPRA